MIDWILFKLIMLEMIMYDLTWLDSVKIILICQNNWNKYWVTMYVFITIFLLLKFKFWYVLIMQGSYIYPFFSFPSFDFVFKKTINFHFQIKTSIYDCDKLSESIKVEMK